MNKIKSFIYTSRKAGISLALKEVLRRTLGISYQHSGVKVKDVETFRLIRSLASKGYRIYRSNNEILVRTDYGVIGVDANDCELLSILAEPFDRMYGVVDVTDGIVIDIGGFLGETALYFLSGGARKVYVFEPIFYRYLCRNITRNAADPDRVVVYDMAVWFEEGLIRRNNEKNPVAVSLSDVLENVSDSEGEIRLVKMDCEGCEYSIIATKDRILRLAENYIIEIHGAILPILSKMANSGFDFRMTYQLEKWVKIYHFWRRKR
jgi:hypothetical protein